MMSRIVKEENQSREIKKQEKSKGFLRKRGRKKKYIKWNSTENIKYAMFLLTHRQSFKSQQARRNNKVFLQLSNHLQTKDPNQCKSHHQKMLTKCHSVQDIINKFMPHMRLSISERKQEKVKQEPRQSYMSSSIITNFNTNLSNQLIVKQEMIEGNQSIFKFEIEGGRLSASDLL